LTVDTEQQLIEKVNHIHDYIVGVMGQPGAAELLKSHERRIGRLERGWLMAIGGGVVLAAVVKMIWGL
jgi:hypothetical protein